MPVPSMIALSTPILGILSRLLALPSGGAEVSGAVRLATMGEVVAGPQRRCGRGDSSQPPGELVSQGILAVGFFRPRASQLIGHEQQY